MISEGQFERFFELVEKLFEDNKISLTAIKLQLADIADAIRNINIQVVVPTPDPEPETPEGDDDNQEGE